MSYEFRDAVRENVWSMTGLAGASGSGKTMSAFRLAQGIVGRDRHFAVIDTEARRALHYAPKPGAEPDFTETFRFRHVELRPPFRPLAYQDAILTAERAGFAAIVVDSFSHCHAGEGGVLDWQEEILAERVKRALARPNERRGEWELREAYKRSAWIEPKMASKKMVQRLLQVHAHVILCLRAEDKIDFVKDKDGTTRVVPMETLAGYKGWIPICDKGLPFELTASFVLTPDKPGYPKPIKLQEQHKAIFPLDKPISEESGRQLAAWAKGGATARPATGDPTPPKPAYEPGAAAGGEPAATLLAIQATIRGYLPGTDDRAKRARVAAIKQVFGVESWSEVAKLPLDRLTAGQGRLEAVCADFAAQLSAA